MRHRGVAVPARALRDLPVPIVDADRILKPSRRERDRVVPAVERLRVVLPDDVVRSMAIVANGDRMVSGLRPCAEVVVHHVAVHASLRVIGQVRSPLCEHERVHAEAEYGAGKKKRKTSKYLVRSHTYISNVVEGGKPTPDALKDGHCRRQHPGDATQAFQASNSRLEASSKVRSWSNGPKRIQRRELWIFRWTLALSSC